MRKGLNLLRKIATIFVNNILVYALGLVYTVLTARLLGPGPRGVLVIAVLVPTWLATLSQLGLPQSLVYNLSRAPDRQKELGWAVGVSARFLAFAGPFALVCFAALRFTPVLRGMSTSVIAGSIVLCSALTVESVVSNLLVGLQNFRWRNVVAVTRPALTAAGLGALWLAGARLTPAVVVWLLALFAGVNNVLGGAYLLWRYRPRVRFRLPGNWRQDYLFYGLKFYLATVAQAINYRLDTLMVSARLGSRDVGLYSIAVGAAELLLFVPISITFVFYPRIAEEKDEARDRVTFLALGVALYLVVSGILALEVLLPWLIPHVFGRAFASAVPAAQWLLPGMAALTVVRVLSYASAGIGKPEYATYTMAVGLGGTIPLDLLLIPRMGILGAAVASTVAYSLSALTVLALYVRLRGLSWRQVFDGLVFEPIRWLQATLASQRTVPQSGEAEPTVTTVPAMELPMLAETETAYMIPGPRYLPDPQSLVPQSFTMAAASRNERKYTRRVMVGPPQEPVTALCIAFYLFVFAIPFDTVNFPTEDFALTKFVGILFLLVCLLAGPQVCFRKPPAAFWFFASYVGVYTTLGLYQQSPYQDLVVTRIITLTQLLCLFWISFNLLRFPRIASRAWFSFVVGSVILALMQVLHIGGKSFDADRALGVARSTALGANANQLCGVLALAAMALLGLGFGRERSKLQPRWIVWPLFAVLGAGMLSTVSRGGLLALVVGFLAYLFSLGRWKVRFRNRALVLFTLTVAVVAVLVTPFVRARFEQTLASGSLAKREFLYPAAIKMFKEKPIFGWGPVEHRYELGRRTLWVYHHEFPDTHNLVLWLATESGVLGLTTYLGCFALAMRGAWLGRKGRQGVQPLGMCFALLMVNTSGTWIYYKLSYLTLAYALASACEWSPRRVLALRRARQTPPALAPMEGAVRGSIG